MTSDFLQSASRTHIHSVIYRSHSALSEDQKHGVKRADGLAYLIKNSYHPQHKDPRWAEPTDRADAAMDKYMASLPDVFKGKFPSLKDIYSQLSADIHAATGSEALFVDMTDKCIEHFNARRLYKLTEPA